MVYSSALLTGGQKSSCKSTTISAALLLSVAMLAWIFQCSSSTLAGLYSPTGSIQKDESWCRTRGPHVPLSYRVSIRKPEAASPADSAPRDRRLKKPRESTRRPHFLHSLRGLRPLIDRHSCYGSRGRQMMNGLSKVCMEDPHCFQLLFLCFRSRQRDDFFILELS